jgi:hypothetical protein
MGENSSNLVTLIPAGAEFWGSRIEVKKEIFCLDGS